MRVAIFVCLFVVAASSHISKNDRKLNDLLERIEASLAKKDSHENSKEDGEWGPSGETYYDAGWEKKPSRSDVSAKAAYYESRPELRRLISKLYSRRLDARQQVRKQEGAPTPGMSPSVSTESNKSPATPTPGVAPSVGTEASKSPATPTPKSYTPSPNNPEIRFHDETAQVSSTTQTPNINTTVNQSNPRDIEMLDFIQEYREFTCPTLEVVLVNYTRGFPVIDDLTWNLGLKINDTLPIIKRAVDYYKNIQSPRLAILQLTEEMAKFVVAQRSRCPASKFQQAIVYVIKKEFSQALSESDSSSLYMELWQKMVSIVPSYNLDPEFLRKLIKVVQREAMGEVILDIQLGLYSDLQKLLEHVYMKVTEYYLTKGDFPSEAELLNITKEVEHHHERALQCKSMIKLFSVHTQNIQNLHERFGGSSVLFSPLSDAIIRIIGEVSTEHYGDTSGIQQALDDMEQPIVLYVDKVFNMMHDYTDQLNVSSTVEIQPIFRQYLDSDQLKVIKEIESALKKGNTPAWVRRVYAVMYRMKTAVYISDGMANDIVKELQDILDAYM